MTKSLVVVFALSTALGWGAAHAQTYKWVDEQGNVTYQDSPPPDSAEFVDRLNTSPDTGETAETQDQDAAQDAAPVREPVTLYALPICDACDLIRNMLEKNGIPFVEKNADQNVQVQKELTALIGQLAVPVLSVGSEVVSGYSRAALTEALTKGGYALDGDPQANQSEPLSREQIEEQATQAAEELTADPDIFPDTSEDATEVVEEIPEDERIKIPNFVE